ncbi:MAG: signal recognition particle subunit [Alyxoria varia]|nr:MAG: signal recognition particle subunit [Alyxoria varia]
MSHNARVEELSDSSDPDEVDPAAIEDSKAAANSIMNPANVPAQAGAQTSGPSIDPEEIKGWHCLYPLYFDSKRTRAEGRRVGNELAVENPLAREICDAVRPLGLRLAFEAGKMHPRDWSNPGRVRVRLVDNGRPISRDVRNKHHLYIKVAQYLKANPANEETPMRLRIPGMPPPTKPPPPPAIPRGWKMSTILPHHSPAISGGGVSENLFKDMMAEMQGQGDEGGSGSVANAKGKKDKKKGKN